MSNEIKNLFATENNTAATVSSRGLAGTAQLTAIASELANNIIAEMNEHIEVYADDIKSSQADHNAMDALINKFSTLDAADVDFLKELSEETLDGMLKSQQSKRSRVKGKAMTLDNYRSLMTAAIAENLIRRATGKEKHASGTRRASGSVEYTIEELEKLSIDQEALRKEIRNVQSKKSIMKSKANFSEDDERWIAMCKVEQQLKDMRVSTSEPKVVEVDTTKNAVNELLAGADLHSMKANDAKALLERIAALTAGKDVTEE